MKVDTDTYLQTLIDMANHIGNQMQDWAEDHGGDVENAISGFQASITNLESEFRDARKERDNL